MKRLLTISAIGFCFALAPAPVLAQDDAGDRVNMVNLYGDEDCPVSEGETITVCARFPEADRYRIPRDLRQSTSPENEAWSNRAQSLEAIGKFGPLSCTPVGGGGDLGCTAGLIQAAYEEREQGSDVRFSQLINEARQERLSEIDADAADTQDRVEALERAYMERLEREREASLPGESADPLPEVELVDPADMPSTQVGPPDFSDNES